MDIQMQIHRLVKGLLCAICYYSGLTWVYHRMRPRRGLLILAYHRIADLEEDPLGLSIGPEDFHQHMQHLAAAYHPVSLGEAMERYEDWAHIKNEIVVTFDDGYEDNYTAAWPILKKLSIPALVFLTIAPVEKESDLWFERISSSILATDAHEIDVTRYDSGVWPLSDYGQKARLIKHLTRTAKSLPESAREELVRYLEDALGTSARPEMLSWAQIRLMRSSGIEFGCHTLNHPILAHLDPERMREEISTAKELMEQRLGESVLYFAYPNGGQGDYDNRVIALLREAGFKAACTLLPGINRAENPYELKRLGIGSDYTGCPGLFTKAVFACEMAGLADHLYLRKVRSGERRADGMSSERSQLTTPLPPQQRENARIWP